MRANYQEQWRMSPRCQSSLETAERVSQCSLLQKRIAPTTTGVNAVNGGPVLEGEVAGSGRSLKSPAGDQGVFPARGPGLQEAWVELLRPVLHYALLTADTDGRYRYR